MSNSPQRQRNLLLAGAALITVLLFYLGALPVAAGLISEPWDKAAHFIVYGTITGLVSVALGGRHGLLLIGAISAIGALDEWHQMYLPGRSAELADLLADALAALCVVLIHAWYRAHHAAQGIKPGVDHC